MRKQLKDAKERRSEEALAKFHRTICEIRRNTDTFTEAIVEYCDHHQIDVEDIVSLVGPALKAEIEREAVESGLVKKTEQNFDLDSLEMI